jgi:hypothetical protein
VSRNSRNNQLLSDESWNDRENKRLRREQEAHGVAALPDDPPTPELSATDQAEIEEYLSEQTTRSWMGGPDSAQRIHQDKDQKIRSSSSRPKKKSSKQLVRTWGSMDCAILAGDDYDGLTQQPCDFDLHPVYAGFLKRSGLLLRHMLLFMTCVHEHQEERAEWREAILELQKFDRERAPGEVGRPRKYGSESAVAPQERLPKYFERKLGIDIHKSAELSYVANMACALYVWFLTKLLRNDRGTEQEAIPTDLELAISITSSVEEYVRLTRLVKDSHPSAKLLDMIGAQTYRQSTTNKEAAETKKSLSAIFGKTIDGMTDADVGRSGFAGFLRLVAAAREAGDAAIRDAARAQNRPESEVLGEWLRDAGR